MPSAPCIVFSREYPMQMDEAATLSEILRHRRYICGIGHAGLRPATQHRLSLL